MTNSTCPWRRRGNPHAQIHLPPLTAAEGLLVTNILNRVVAAIWHTHGGAMGDYASYGDPDVPVYDHFEYPRDPDPDGNSDGNSF